MRAEIIFIEGISLIIKLIADDSGTARIIPTGPQTQNQKINEIRINRGESLSSTPIILGSTKLPIVIWVAIREAEIAISCQLKPYWIKQIIIGNNDAAMDPKLGMKLSTKISSPEITTKSIL